nr:SoxR reducing system RseC family protein [Sporomusa malonica]
MDKEQEGIVLEVYDGMAKVKASRHSDCENCGTCAGNEAIVAEVLNPVGAQRGQRVVIEIKEANMLRAAFVVYMLPLIAAVGGAFVATYFTDLHQVANPLWYQIGGGFAAFGLSIMYVRYYDRNAKTDDKMKPVIIRILS